jgi:cytochrome P450
MTTGEVMLNALNLAVAGTQTTRNSLANMVHAMARFPGSFAAVRADPGLIPTAVDECVRWANPVRHLARTTTCDVELGGVAIAAGSPVVAWHGSANRDEAVFALPHRFDVGRRPNPHIGFSAGPHGCPGSGLARVQMRSALAHLAALFSAVELAGEPRRLASNFLDGVEELPVRLVAA